MPLVIPVLRVCTLFLNTYDSFKVLKLPRPSSRNGGRPSVRAMTQRKRDMKGILAVWIVWCLIALYEKLVEQIICIFIPFYDEIKSLILLFLLLTRAKGAEPIYLHIVRPFLKPYTPTIDAILDISGSLGDFLFALVLSPFNVSSSWWNRQPDDVRNELETDNSLQTPAMYSRNSGIAVSSQLDVSAASGPHYTSTGGIPLPPTNDYPVPGMPIGAPRDNRIWNPPPSSYSDEDAPTPPPETAAQVEERKQFDEWRQYPAFPSAYPATPYVPSKLSLSDAPVQKMPLPSFSEEEQSSYAAPVPSSQDFRKSLLPAREPSDPSSADSLSDEYRESGVQHLPARERSSESNESSSMEVDTSDGDEEDEEDSFNMTLKTPLHPSGSIRVRSRFGELSTRELPPMSEFLSGLPVSEGESSSDSVADRHVAAGQKRRHLSDSLSADEADARSSTVSTDDERHSAEDLTGNTTIHPVAAAEAHSRSTSGGVSSDPMSVDSSDIDTTSSSKSNMSGRPEVKKRRVQVATSSSRIPAPTRRTRSTTAATASKAQAGPTPARKARERAMKATRQASRSRSATASTESRASSRAPRKRLPLKA